MSINKLHLTAITTTIDNKQECSCWTGESGERETVEERGDRGRLRRFAGALYIELAKKKSEKDVRLFDIY